MKLDELICCLKRCKEKYGNINVCVYDRCHEMPCESIVPEFEKEMEYKNFCEDDVLVGDFLMLK